MKLNSKFPFVAVLAGAMLSLGGPARANLVANPAFDLNSPPAGTAPLDWTLTNAPSGSDFTVGSGFPGGIFGAFSSPNAANFGAIDAFDDQLSQVLVTTAGQAYTISFELAHTQTNSLNDFSVQFGGVPIFSLVNAASFGYTLETLTATAATSSTVLAFFGRENPAFYQLDNVSVEAVGSAVPEPGTWAMLLVGFAGLGFAAYRKKTKPALMAA